MADNPSLVLFPGLAADERLLSPQAELPYEVITPGWIEPRRGEKLPQFARRVADSVRWPDRFVVGGVSFGGMLAAELASLVKPEGVVLIASCLSSRCIPTLYRFFNLLCKAVPDPALSLGTRFSRPIFNFVRGMNNGDERIMADMRYQTPTPRLRRATNMVLNWDGVAALPCPRLWIHGQGDLVIPLKRLHPNVPDVVVPGAGHLVNWTHRDEVNHAVGRFVESLGVAVNRG